MPEKHALFPTGANPGLLRVALPVPLPQLFDYRCDDVAADDLGRCVRVPFGRGEKTGVIVALPSVTEVDPSRLKPVIHVQRDVPALPADWLALVAFVSRYYHAPPGEVIALALPPGLRHANAVSGAVEDPLIVITEAGQAAMDQGRRPSRGLRLLMQARAAGALRRSQLRALPDGAALAETLRRGWLGFAPAPCPDAAAAPLGAPALTAEQRQAVDAVCQHTPGFTCWLLQGVTGSGKTEVYLSLAAAALARQQQVLMLVPEIALTPQLETRVASRFPAAAVVSLHSAQSSGARSRGFMLALEGRADIVLGTRLSVFTPLPRLGLVLVDEEHDASYKQQEGVRYSARDLAVWRARQRVVPIVLGSATPSLESWQHACQGRYRMLHLRARARAEHLPTVRCIDTRRQRLDEGLSPALLAALAQRLQRGEQSLIFLNRRGYAPVLSCSFCGWVSDCPNCSAKLVVHLVDRRLRCHHCGFDSAMVPACPSCGNPDIQALGRGTQRIEARLVAQFPQAKVVRIDRDAVRTRRQWEAVLARIAAGEADILVGTQMMAKGHDFPRLTLVGVIGADASLHAADFRAPERLFQQLMQVGGRAGRAHLPGEVLIQTDYPEHPLYRFVVAQDVDRFAASELGTREAAGFPPFSFQVMLRADAPQLEQALAFLRHAQALARTHAPDGVQVFDPVPMRMTRLARRERGQLLLEASDRGLLQAFLGHWLVLLRAQRVPHALRWQIDVDPLDI